MIQRRSLGPSVDASSAAAPAQKERMEWLDVAKGVCILLVVLHHITSKYVMEILPPDLVWVAADWKELNGALKPLRMPVFFVISGFFAAGAIHRPWSRIRRRVTSPYYLYVLWSLVYVVIYTIETDMEANRTTSVVEFLGELVWASTSAWFLFALAAYFAIAKLLRNLPHPLVIGAAFALSISTGWMGIDAYNRVSVLSHLVFFLVGAYTPQVVRFYGNLPTPVIGGLATSYVAVFVFGGIAGLPSASMLPLASSVGVPLGLAAARRLGEVALVARPLAWLGQRTLRVYVLHLGVLALVYELPIAVHASGFDGVLFAAALPILVTATITGLSLLVHELIQRAGGAWMFALPARWAGMSTPTEAQRRAAADISAESGEYVVGQTAPDARGHLVGGLTVRHLPM